ncbi:F-box protein FBW2-like [Macadamia integrifolia]|uniref:F-box protein FBW2-like n=1 Tax=Macadamia integrifolia TaxID=60698 RepID=UPI001C501883|nr:F-box protein FBW2-like [Macadamia integrifolia]XP_042492881.1 F-box protein FBW2-like [Macadamia integrifolia]
MDGSEIRRWDELIPDALGLIFSNLSLKDKLTLIPTICKSWRKAVMGPYCWQEIDIEEWSCRRQPEELDRMLQMLITRSSGSPRKLCVSDLPNDTIFSYVADHASSLQTLQLPGSKISDSIVEHLAGKMATITLLDLTYCGKIGARALEAFGKNCKFLVTLRRNMHPSDVDVGNRGCQDNEAHAIATTMPKLKHLEIAYMVITTEGILDILSGCRELESLDVRGCWDVKLDDKFLDEKCSGLKVLGPSVMDNYYRNYYDDLSDYSDSSGYSAWMFSTHLYDGESSDGVWDDEQRLEELELRFYEGFDEEDDDDFGEFE